jgi:hypothetical protein
MLLHLRDDVIINHIGNTQKLPKWLKDVLETSAVDETGFSLKQSKFNIYQLLVKMVTFK